MFWRTGEKDRKRKFPWDILFVTGVTTFMVAGLLNFGKCHECEPDRTSMTISQVKSYEAAVSTFKDGYHALPGDIADAARLPSCNLNCNPFKDGAGDNIVGNRDFGSTLKTGLTVSTAPPSSIADETILFWQHLLHADLISGVTDVATNSASRLSWGDSLPAARTGGGFVVGHADGKFPEKLSPQNAGMKGTIVVLKSVPDDSVELDAPNKQPLSPARAARIDRKLDDGMPSTGYVQAYGAPSCFLTHEKFSLSSIGSDDCDQTGKNPCPNRYNESNPKKDCGLIFLIQRP